MSTSRIIAAASLAALFVSGCAGPGNVSTSPGTMPQTNSAHSIGQSSGVDQSTGVSPQSVKARLFWRPDHLTLQKGVKQQAKLFFEGGRRPLRIADDCTGRVALDQIGFARIKKYRINIYEVLALRTGPFRCSVIAKVKGEPDLHAVLPISVMP
jgi:hypothetical protein